MKKSIKILISLLLICTIMLPNGVRAVVGSDSAIGSNNGNSCGSKCPTGDSTKVYIPLDSSGKLPTKAIRVTLMDGNGNLIKDKGKNFAADTLWNDSNIKQYGAYISNGYSRVMHVNYNSQVSWGQIDKNNLNNYFTKDTNISNALKKDDGLSYASVADYFNNMAESADKVNSFLTSYFGVTDFKSNNNASNWFLLIEPLVPVRKNYKALVFGTPTEFTRYGASNDGKAPILTDYYLDHLSRYNYLYITKTNFSYNGLSANFTALSAGNGRTTMVGMEKNGNGAGLVWIGKNATPPTPCSNYADDTSIWVAGWKYDPDKANDKVASNPNNNTIRSTCGLAPTPCHNYADDKSIWTDGWEYAAKNAYLNVPHGSDKDEIRKKCGSAPIPCSDYKDKNTTIWIDGWVYDSNKASTKIAADAANNTDTIRKTCGYQITCETDDIYNKSTDFTHVQLTPNASRNCCRALEKKYANDKNKLNELYRDHNECYECKYDPTKIKPTCSTGDNKKTTGYTFTRDVGNATVTADTYTCISWAVDGKDKNVSKNLFTKKEINKYCKVICSETVTLEFPFFNNGNSVRYVTKNSIFAWPKKNNSDEDELKLKASGKLTCWYRVNLVGLYNEFGRDKNGAVELFNQCKDDMNKSLTTPENILPGANSYNLSGSFKVKTDDDPNYVSLAKENGTNSVSYTKQTSSAEITLSATKGNVSSLVRAAEKLKFEVTENANFVISNTGKDAGYSYSYDGKYYRSKTDVGISNIKSNNIIKFEPSLKFNEKTGSGNVSIIYSNIGGSSPKFIENEQTYENKDESGLKNHRCVYKKINNGKEYLCPSGTKNEGMNLSIIMTNESLSYEEAVKKYCNSDSDSGMTVCPSNSYYSGKPISKSCYDNENCQKLTCYIHECTDSGGTCHILNSCMTRQIEDYGKTLDEAKKICTNKYCDGKPGNIEYRVIDLKDPFPGIEAKSGFSSFNSNIKGRKPGSNWNSTKIVRKEILNNRGVKGDEVYNLTPLYEFNLTPSVIKAIREYNDNHSYDDFTLSCKGNNKQACVASGFDFKTKFGIVKVIEQCKGISNLGKFNSCYNNDSLR